MRAVPLNLTTNLVEALFLLGGTVPWTPIAQPPHRREGVHPAGLVRRRVVKHVARGVNLHVRRGLVRIVGRAVGEPSLGAVVTSYDLVYRTEG